MDSKIFEIVDENTRRVIDRISWDNLAKQHPEWKYSGGVSLRSAYRKESARREKKALEKPKATIKEGFPRVLCIDIETAPLVCFTWGIYDQRLSIENIISDWYVLSYAAKWLFEDEIMSEVVTPKESSERNDKRLISSIWKLFDQADIVVNFNGDKFDLKKINTRFILYGLYPPSAYYSVDLYKTVKEMFSFTSGKLSFVNTYLGLDDKTHPDYELWKKCYFGDAASLKELADYNINDTRVTELLYLKMLPWLKGHPNINVYTQDDVQVCPKCGSEHLLWEGKYYYTQTSRYDAFRCGDCGSTGRAKKNNLSKEKSKDLVR